MKNKIKKLLVTLIDKFCTFFITLFVASCLVSIFNLNSVNSKNQTLLFISISVLACFIVMVIDKIIDLAFEKLDKIFNK